MADPGNSNTQLDGSFNITDVLTNDISSSIVTDASAGLFVAPYIAAMYADASGTVGLLQQVTVSVFDIDNTFSVTLSDVNAVKIMKAFQVSDVNGTGTDASAADVKVDAVNDASGGFQEALVAALVAGPTDAASTTLVNWLTAEARADTVALLKYNTLSNLLEASDLLAFSIELDASSGAANMWKKISATTVGNDQLRRMLYTQLPISNTHAYAVPSDSSSGSAEIVETLNFLPLVKGNKLAFIFDVTVGDYSTEGEAPTSGAIVTSTVNDANTTGSSAYVGGANVADKYTQSLIFSRPSRRRVAVTMQMSGTTDGAAFNTATGYVNGVKTISLA
jgi:hypothetical protein